MPGGVIRIPAEPVAFAWDENTFAGSLTPLPVITATKDPALVTDTPPFVVMPSGAVVPADPRCIVLADGTVVGPNNPLPTTGGGGGPISADMVTYTNPAAPTVTNVEEALDTLFAGGGDTNWPGVMARISIGV